MIEPFVHQFYWLLSVIERAKSTDPEKIIATSENQYLQYANGKVVKMEPIQLAGPFSSLLKNT